MSQRCTWCCWLVGVLITSVAGSADADLVTVGATFPTVAEVIAATPDQAPFGDDASTSLAQSFTVESAFSAQSIFLAYDNDTRAPGDKTLTMTIFEVADVQATSHDEPPMLGNIVFSDSVTFPYVGESDTIARIDLDSALPLAASVGTSGYTIRFSGTTNPGWEWLRSTADVYAGGHAYEDGVEKGAGISGRDFSLAVSSVPEPSAILYGGLISSIVGCGVWLRRRLA